MRRFHDPRSVQVRRRREQIRSEVFGEFKAGHHWNKLHPMDCGQPRCLRCHRAKALAIPSRQTLRSCWALQEWIELVG